MASRLGAIGLGLFLVAVGAAMALLGIQDCWRFVGPAITLAYRAAESIGMLVTGGGFVALGGACVVGAVSPNTKP